MPNINKYILNNNLDFIQFKHFDFSDKKINHEKILSERLNKPQKLKIQIKKILFDENKLLNMIIQFAQL